MTPSVAAVGMQVINRRTGERGTVTAVDDRYMIVGRQMVWREFWGDWEVER